MWMGTGKSCVALGLAEHWKSRFVVIACPLSVCGAWRHQLTMFAPPEWGWIVLGRRIEGNSWLPEKRINRSIAAKGAALKEFFKANGGRTVVVVANYEFVRTPEFVLAIERGELQGFHPDLAIADEIHKLKDPWGFTQKMVDRIFKRAPRKLGLTGTLMPHSPGDVFAQYRILDPKIFGWSFIQFRSHYAIMGGFKNKNIVGWAHQDELREKIDRIRFKCGKEVLDLPPFRHEQVDIELSVAARKAYDALEDTFRADVEGGTITAANALVRLIRLQQLTSGRAVLDGDEDGSAATIVDKGKLEACTEFCESLGADEKIVFFCRFHADLDSVKAACAANELQYSELSGRVHELEEWQRDPARRVLGVQIQSGGVGIDLTMAARAVYVSMGFSLGDYEQSLARLHRPGQEKPVIYYHLVARDTIDERVYGALRARKKVVEAVLEGMRPTADVRK
jgi:Mesyanzhinovviridae DNA helicase